ncbi:GL22522 [Drosophila persimilis]|uniref:GL22522 n=1 Tax=Drosophila persimilis TaxID=7234 RepID=B4H191_DROPE|nr:GL22522 [Drosophila persimilis]
MDYTVPGTLYEVPSRPQPSHQQPSLKSTTGSQAPSQTIAKSRPTVLETQQKRCLKMDEASGTTTTDGKSLDEAPVAAGLEPTQPIGFLQLFRFSTCGEIAWLFFGFLMCCVKALTLPAVVIIYSEFTSMLVDRAMEFGTSSKVHALPLFGGGKSLTNATLAVRNEALYDDSISYGLLLTIASVVMFIAGIFSVDIFNVVALRQVSRMRIMLFTSVMRQEIGWHDLASKQNFVQSMIE